VPSKEVKEKGLKSIFSLLGKNLWLTIGLVCFLGMFLYGASSSLGGGVSASLLSLLDWLSASIIFFFIGALIGSVIDLVWRKEKFRLHTWLTMGFWLVCIVAALIVNKGEKLVVAVFFPVIYGIFFTSFAFTKLFPAPLQYSSALKGIFNLAFSGIFFCWLKLEVDNKASKSFLRKVFLAIIFIVLLIGLYGCAAALSVQ
jgi:hypothetical protein